MLSTVFRIAWASCLLAIVWPAHARAEVRIGQAEYVYHAPRIHEMHLRLPVTVDPEGGDEKFVPSAVEIDGRKAAYFYFCFDGASVDYEPHPGRASAGKIELFVPIHWRAGERHEVALHYSLNGKPGRATVSLPAPEKGGAWGDSTDNIALEVREEAGLARVQEPVDVDLTVEQERFPDPERRLRATVMTAAGAFMEIPCQVYDVKPLSAAPYGGGSNTPLQRFRVVMPLTMQPKAGAVVHLWAGPPRDKPADSALRLDGNSLGGVVRNAAYRVELEPTCGQIVTWLDTRLDIRFELQRKDMVGQGAVIHRTPDLFRPDRQWSHALDWTAPEHRAVAGPVMVETTRRGEMPWIPEAVGKVQYRFFAGRPEVRAASSRYALSFASRRTFAKPAEFDECFRDGGIAVGGPAGPVALAESDLLFDHVGNRLAGKPAFSAALIGRKVFRLDGQPGRAARLYVFGGGAGSFNGRPLPAGSKVQTGGWTEFAIDSAWLRPGDNEVVFTEGSVALDAEAAPSRHSFTSRDNGTTWEPAAGEFLARLRLDRFVAGGVVTSDVIDVADDGKAAIRPLAAIGKLVVTCTTRTPPGTSVAVEARSGRSPRPDASWSGWADSAAVPPARYMQWRATLATSDRTKTPVLQSVTVEAGGDLEAAASADLRVETFENHSVVRGSHPYEFQRPGEKLARLRTRWKLDEIVAAGKTEMERLLLLRNWVRRQWPCNDSGSGRRTWDAIEILSAGPDQHGMCVHFATAFYQCALALGYVARPVILANHFVADVWSNDTKGWVLMDVEATHAEGFRKYGTAHYLCSGDRTPLGALEIHRRLHRAVAANAATADDIIQVYAADTAVGPHVATDVVRPVEELMNYARFCLPPRNNFLDRLEPWEEFHGEDHYHSDMYLWWQGPEPAGVPPEYSRRTDRPGDIDWTVNTVGIALSATGKPDELAVTVDTVTPNFKAFVYRFNDGPWQTTAGEGSHPDERTGTLSWKLAPGANTIEVQPRNAFDRDGVASRATVLLAAMNPAASQPAASQPDAAPKPTIGKWPPALKSADAKGTALVAGDRLLEVPQKVREELEKGAVPFVVAKAAPRVELTYHGDLPETVPSCLWSAWGDICVADDGKVYVGTGDHGSDAEGKAAALLYVYDPRDGKLEKAADLDAIVPRGQGEPAWSKLHAGITQGADGMIYFTGTLNDGSQAIDAARYHWSAARPGGQLFQYDPGTGKSNLFLNLPGGRCTATAVMDRERNTWWCNLEGRVGDKGIDAICAIDLATKKVLLQSPDGSSAAMNRNFALGRDGCVYFNGVEHTIWKADPRTATIGPTRSVWPEVASTRARHAGMRASTAESKDGWIYGCTHTPGHLFRYSPTKDVLEMLGPDFLQGEYTTVCVLSPDERFVYYMPGSHGRAYLFGTPLVQYEIATGSRKVIAFLAEAFESACDYVPGGTYGVKISADGSTIYANLNGHPSASSGAKTSEHGFGLTSFAVIHIPASER